MLLLSKTPSAVTIGCTKSFPFMLEDRAEDEARIIIKEVRPKANMSTLFLVVAVVAQWPLSIRAVEQDQFFVFFRKGGLRLHFPSHAI